RSESSIERIRILVAEQKCHLFDIHLRPVEVLVRQFLPRLKKQLPESCAVIDYSPLQSPIAQPEFARHCRYLRPASHEQALENPFHLLTDRTLRTALFKCAFELRIQHVKQLGIVGKEWSVEIGRMQDERIPSRSERDRPLEIRFVEPGRLRAALQLDPFRRHKVPCAGRPSSTNEAKAASVSRGGVSSCAWSQTGSIKHSSLVTLIFSSSGAQSCLKRARRVRASR